jgi:hypothetical protein
MSLTSSRFEKNLKREDHPLPSTVEGILDLLRSVMSSGVVRKIVVEEGRPIVAYRDSGEGDLEEEELTLDAALRNCELLEYANDTATSFETVCDMMYVLQMNGLHPVCWVTGPGNGEILVRWFQFLERGMPGRHDQMAVLQGFPIKRVKTISEDVLILCGSRYRDGDIVDIEFGVKAGIELRSSQDDNTTGREADDPVWNDPGESPPAARHVAPPSGGEPERGWSPKGLLGVRMEDRRRVR